MNTATITEQRPFTNPASLRGRSFLITSEHGTMQRESLPENWLIVKVNPHSIQAIQRANQKAFPEDNPGGRDLPY